MCQIYSSISPAAYEPQTRSFRQHGAVTSIRLEARFWSLLDELAQGEGMSTPRFLNKLYDEVLDDRGEVGNFTSLLRVVCTVYLERRGRPSEPANRAA
jgi:predicted DNA-binding ribbon-helix-helix protein